MTKLGTVTCLVPLLLVVACGDGGGGGNDNHNTAPVESVDVFVMGEGEEIDDWKLVRGSNGWLHVFITRVWTEFCTDAFSGMTGEVPGLRLSHAVSQDDGETWEIQPDYPVLGDPDQNPVSSIRFQVTAGDAGAIAGVARLGRISDGCGTTYYPPTLWTWQPDGTIVFQPAQNPVSGNLIPDPDDEPRSLEARGPGPVAISTHGGLHLVRAAAGDPVLTDGSLIRQTEAQAGSLLTGRVTTDPGGVRHVMLVDGVRTFDIGDPAPVWTFDTPSVENDVFTHNLFHATITEGHWTQPTQVRADWLAQHELNSQGDCASGTRVRVVSVAAEDASRVHVLLSSFEEPWGSPPPTQEYLSYAVAEPTPDGMVLGEPTFIPGNDGGFLRDPDGNLAIQVRSLGADAGSRTRLLPITADGVDRVLATPRDREGDASWQANRPDQLVWLGGDRLAAAWRSGSRLAFAVLPLTDVQSNRTGAVTPEHLQAPAGSPVPLSFAGLPDDTEVRWDLESDGYLELEGPSVDADLAPGWNRIAAWAFGPDGEIWVRELTVETMEVVGGGWVERGRRLQSDVGGRWLVEGDRIYAYRLPATLVVLERQANRLVELGTLDVNLNASPGWVEPPQIDGVDRKIGDRLYLRVDLDGIVAVDVSDPANPQEVGRTRMSNSTFHYLLQNAAYGPDYAWAIDSYYFFQIDLASLSYSGPADVLTMFQTYPGEMAFLDSGHPVVGGLERLFVLQGDGTFPPAVIGQVDLTPYIMNAPQVRVSGTRVYLLAAQEVITVDVSDPTSPEVVSSWSVPNPWGGSLDQMEIDGDRAFFLQSDQWYWDLTTPVFRPALHVFSLATDPPTEVARHWDPLPTYLGQLRVVSGDELLLSLSHQANPPLWTPDVLVEGPGFLFRTLTLHDVP